MTIAPLYYLAGFSTEGAAQSMTFTIAGNVGTIASGTYAYQTFASLMPTTYPYSAFAAAFKAAADTAGGGPYTVTWTAPTTVAEGFFTISRATAFTLTWSSGAANLRTRAAMGFAADVSGLQNSYSSTIRPYYMIVPTEAARSSFSDVYEPDEIVSEATSDGGTSYAVARQTNELWCDWFQPMEPKAATLTSAAVAARPLTWQALVKHCRGQRPIGVYESATGNRLYKLRAESGSFRPDRYVSDYDGLWNIPFKMRDLGALP